MQLIITQDGNWYEGTVVKENADKTFRVVFNDGDVGDRITAAEIRVETFL